MLRLLYPDPKHDRRTLQSLAALTDQDGRAILTAAGRLAAWRVARQAAAAVAFDPPQPTRHVVTRVDLLRACMAVAPERCRDLTLGQDCDVDAWEGACATLADRLDEAPEQPLTELCRHWALCWEQSEGRVDGLPSLLLSTWSAMGDLLPQFSKPWLEGLQTTAEVGHQIIDRLCATGARDLAGIPTPFIDRNDGMTASDTALQTDRAVVISGEAGAGRRSLLAAWTRLRHGCDAGYTSVGVTPELDIICHPHHLTDVLLRDGPRDADRIVVLSWADMQDRIEHRGGEPGAHIPVVARLLAQARSRQSLSVLAISRAGARDETEYTSAGATIVRLPAWTVRDAVAASLCSMFTLEAFHGPGGPGLANILAYWCPTAPDPADRDISPVLAQEWSQWRSSVARWQTTIARVVRRRDRAWKGDQFWASRGKERRFIDEALDGPAGFVSLLELSRALRMDNEAGAPAAHR